MKMLWLMPVFAFAVGHVCAEAKLPHEVAATTDSEPIREATATTAGKPTREMAAATGSEPIVFNSNETAGPGDVFGLQGMGFGNDPQVWYALVTGKEKKLAPTARLQVVSASDRNISALLPTAGIKNGTLVAVWIRNGKRLSKPVFLNKARAVTIEYDEIMPGQTFRIFGRNLAVQGHSPEVRFAIEKGKGSWPAKVVRADAYTIEVIAPATISKDARYKLFVTNGAGGSWGESAAEEVLTGRNAAADPFGLKAAWGTEFTFAQNIYNVRTDSRLPIKAKGDGITDDRKALQQAIDIAHRQGGGVIYFPEGKYRLEIPTGSGLVMHSNIVLKGDGPGKSIIQYGFGTPPPYPDPIGKGGWSDTTTEGVAILWPLGTTLTGLYNLEVDNVNTSGKWRHSMKTMVPPVLKPGAGGSKFFAANCRFNFSVAWGLSWGYVDRMVIRDCFFDSKATITWPWLWHCNGSTNFSVRNNTIRYAAGRFGFNESYNGIIENNDITRLGDLQNPKGETGGFNIDFARDIVMMDNRMDVEGREIEYHNQGETILSQGGNPDQMSMGIVTKATATTITDATKSWKPIITGRLDASDALCIVDGKGAGQWRRIVKNDATTITVEEPWTVVPDKSSHYVVICWSAEDWLVKDNVLEGNNRGIWFYCGNTDVAIVGNKLTNSEGIYLRADQRRNMGLGRFNLSWNTLVADNKVINTNGLRPAFVCNTLALVSPDSLHGIGALGIEIRRNFVQAHVPNSASFVQGEGYFNDVAHKKPITGSAVGILGTIFDKNIVENAVIGYRLDKSIDQTVIKDPVYKNVKTPYLEAKGTILLNTTGAQAFKP